MRKLFALVILSFAALFVSVGETGCATTPSQKEITYTSLKVVAVSVDTAMKAAAQLYKDGNITAAQWNRVADYHDNYFQPAFRTALIAANLQDSALAPQDVANLAAQLLVLISDLTTKK